MNSIAFYADGSSYLFEKRFDGKSAFERAMRFADGLMADGLADNAGIFVPEKIHQELQEALGGFSIKIPVETIVAPEWGAHGFVIELSSWVQKKADKGESRTVIFALASCPFYDTARTRDLLAHHKKYASEFTFAEGYAEGLVPAVIDAGALRSLAELAKQSAESNRSDSACPERSRMSEPRIDSRVLFEVMKSNINSFEVETIIAERDARFYRFDFSCVSKRQTIACERLFYKAQKRGIFADGAKPFADDLCALAVESPEVQRTVPSFYALQISSAARDNPVYSPYYEEYAKKFGHAPDEAAQKNTACFMPLDTVKKILCEASEFSGEAVVSLSAWGEPLFHPDIERIIEAALSYSGLSLLIETDGSLVTQEFAVRVRQIADAAPPRTNGHEKIYWIAEVDAMDEDMYRKMRRETGPEDAQGVPSLEKARTAYEILRGQFGGAAYPQFLRTIVNEGQLEVFYRHYKEKGNVIIQKYDHFCGRLPDLRPADLSPLDRYPCWHLTRGMVILADGGVPLCREYVLDALPGINAVTGSIESAWQKTGEAAGAGDAAFVKPREECGKCDEYYTFNF
ncbi:MAG: spiro-SPASM protein [Treponemataceae bacterium]|nr:MAG: spiro-SPASM protein [Treponemataceae bacterium]